MSEKLYDLASDLAVINSEIIDAEGVISEELEVRLDNSSLGFQEKILSIGRWDKNIDGDINTIANEVKRLQTKKKVCDNLKTRLKSYVLDCMQKADVKKIEGPLFNVTRVKNNPSVEIVDAEKIPAAFTTVIPEQHVPDTKAILIALKESEVAGAKLIDDKEHLRIQ